jgi:hypothetical protein
MYDWLLDNAQFVLLVLCCTVITIGLIGTGLTQIRRAEFDRLQNEIKELSAQVKALEVSEQRRFLKELKSHSEGSQPSLSTNVQLLKSETAAPPLAP